MNIPKNLLIVRTDRIGDVILSLPLAEAVKKAYPDCRITFLVREYTRPLAENNPYIDNILILRTKGAKPDFTGNISLLLKHHFDSVIIVYPTFIISLIIYLSGISTRIGTGYRWYSLLFNQKVYEHRKNAEKHELEYNFSLLQKIGLNVMPSRGNINFNLPVDENSLKKVSGLLLAKGISESDKLVIIHPGSGGSAADLPVDKMGELIKLISERTEAKVVLTGSSSEEELCRMAAGNSGAVILAGMLDLKELVSLINLSSVFVSNSTGPLHIAAALGVYVIGFYPKIRACSAERWGPYTKNSAVFTPELDCENCSLEQCVRLNCMNYINISKVFEKTEKILKLLPYRGDSDV